MKAKTYVIFLITFLVVGLILTAQANKGVAANPIELRLATFDPQGAGACSEGVSWYANELEKRTNGKIKIKIFWSGSLAKIVELPGAVKSGMADMATVVGDYHKELFPYVFGSSFSTMVLAGAELGDWIEPYRKIYNEFSEERDTFKRQNQKILSLWEFDKMSVMSIKPIRNFEDAKGVRIRCSGEYLPRVFKAAGFNTMSIPSTEVYEALNKGMIDAIQSSADTANKYRWYEACKYNTEIPMFGTTLTYFLSINLDTWNKLPPDVQNEMVKLGEELTKLMPGFSEKVRNDFKKNFINARGTFVMFSEADQREWKSRTAKDIMEYYIQKMEAKGIPRVREIVYRFAELMNYKWQ